MKFRYIFLLLLLTAVFSASISCRQAADTSKKTIVVTYSILGSVVKDMVGDQANVIISIPDGLDPHEWGPSPRDIEAINKADMVIRNGLGMESGLEKTLALAQKNGVKLFTASDFIIIRHVGAGEGIPSGDPDQVTGAPDPHFWMDPLSMKSVVAALAPAIKTEVGIDVTGKAAAVMNALDELDSQIKQITAAVPAENRKLVTGHESMGYFAQRYDFKLVGVILPGLSSQAGENAAALAAVKQAIKENQVKAIFTELEANQAVAKAIGEETGVKVVELITHKLPPDGSYFTFMREVALTISDALK